MTIPILGVFLGVLFLAFCYLHFKCNILSKKIKEASISNYMFHLSVLGMSLMFIEKGILTREEFDEFAKTGTLKK